MADAGEWERIARLIEDDDAVASAVRTAAQRGDDPWEALLDGLDEAGALAYLQAEDTGMELTDALAQLPRVFAMQPDLNEATDEDDLTAATRIVDRILSADGLRTLRLVEDDESWPLVVLPTAAAQAVASAVAELGRRVVLGG